MSKSICSVAGCNCMVVARGYCNKHYLRWKHHGDPLGGVNGASVRKVIDYPDCTRICTRCGKRLPIAMFDRDKFASKGRKSKCKKCRSSQMHVLYESEKYEKCSHQRRYRLAHLDEVRLSDRHRYERDKEKRIDLAKEAVHIRRARISAGLFDKGITRRKLRDRDGDRCCYCGVKMRFRAVRHGQYDPILATIEHVTPISKGGMHTWDNVRLACWECNVKQGNRQIFTVRDGDSVVSGTRNHDTTDLDTAA